MDRLAGYFNRTEAPAAEAIDAAFWGACHGGRLAPAQFLLGHGADLNWLPGWERLTPLDAAARSGATDVITWLRSRGAKTSSDLDVD